MQNAIAYVLAAHPNYITPPLASVEQEGHCQARPCPSALVLPKWANLQRLHGQCRFVDFHKLWRPGQTRQRYGLEPWTAEIKARLAVTVDERLHVFWRTPHRRTGSHSFFPRLSPFTASSAFAVTI